MTQLRIEERPEGDGFVATFFDEGTPRMYAVIGQQLIAAAEVDPACALFLEYLGRHANRHAGGGIPVAPDDGGPLFAREYSSAQARAALGDCSRASLWKLQQGSLAGAWFKRPGPGGRVLVFDADEVDALARVRGRVDQRRSSDASAGG